MSPGGAGRLLRPELLRPEFLRPEFLRPEARSVEIGRQLRMLMVLEHAVYLRRRGPAQ